MGESSYGWRAVHSAAGSDSAFALSSRFGSHVTGTYISSCHGPHIAKNNLRSFHRPCAGTAGCTSTSPADGCASSSTSACISAVSVKSSSETSPADSSPGTGAPSEAGPTPVVNKHNSSYFSLQNCSRSRPYSAGGDWRNGMPEPQLGSSSQAQLEKQFVHLVFHRRQVCPIL